MKGQHHIKISNQKVQFSFAVQRNITIIRGDSATGKTTLVGMLSDYETLGKQSGVTVKCDKPSMTCQIIYDVDTFKNPPENLEFNNGELKIQLKDGAKKVIVKLYNGKYLKDEIIFNR